MSQKRQPLIDLDVIRYEIGFCGEYVEEGELRVREFDFVAELLDQRIKGICEDTESTEPPIGFLTGSDLAARIVNRVSRYNGNAELVIDTPFRERIACTKPYKGTRKGAKPFHFENITAYLLSEYDCRISNGLEADDLMCIEQTSRLRDSDTIICTRDKDLRMCPGWQFGWECGKQPSFGPVYVDNKGTLQLTNGKLKGTGLKFFFSQMLTGDTVDNIPGCKGMGPAKAFKLLDGCNTKREHELAVIGAYQNVYGDAWKDMLEEQSKLLWMVRELNEDGSPIHYEWKY